MNEVLCRKQTLIDNIAVSVFVNVLVEMTNTLFVFDLQFAKIFAVQESRVGGLRKDYWGLQEGPWEPWGCSRRVSRGVGGVAAAWRPGCPQFFATGLSVRALRCKRPFKQVLFC